VSDAPEVRVRPLVDGDLDQADRIVRVAFGTFLGAPGTLVFRARTPVDLLGCLWRRGAPFGGAVLGVAIRCGMCHRGASVTRGAIMSGREESRCRGRVPLLRVERLPAMNPGVSVRGSSVGVFVVSASPRSLATAASPNRWRRTSW
jgi:hypothetical protein